MPTVSWINVCMLATFQTTVANPGKGSPPLICENTQDLRSQKLLGPLLNLRPQGPTKFWSPHCLKRSGSATGQANPNQNKGRYWQNILPIYSNLLNTMPFQLVRVYNATRYKVSSLIANIPGGLLNRVLYRQAPASPIYYIYHFWQGRQPYYRLSIENGRQSPFTQQQQKHTIPSLSFSLE